MPRNWEPGGKRTRRRSVEKHYKRYDAPRVVWEAIHSKVWPYKTRREFFELRDLAYQSLLYLSTCRASELCRARLVAGFKPSVTKDQFRIDGDFLRFRGVIILKRREIIGRDPQGFPEWGPIQHLENYPIRNEIPLPLEGGLADFTDYIMKLLDNLSKNEELFKFKYQRGWQIVNEITGEMQHYLRDMGLKMWSRALDRNIKDLQDFSGHARLENLVKYLGEGQIEKAILEVKF